MGGLHFNAPLGVIPCEYPDKLYLSRNLAKASPGSEYGFV